MNKTVAIIGSREAPESELVKIGQIAEFFAKKGWVLRTGGAIGCDSAGLAGFRKVAGSKIELYLPWQGYEDHYGGILWSQENWNEAAKLHLHWDTMKLNSKIFHSRNVAIALGVDNEQPADVVVCWTLNGEAVGGSAMVISVAKQRKIKLFNLGESKGLDKLRKFCKKL